MELIILITCIVGVIIEGVSCVFDWQIREYVRLEWEESQELNKKLDKVYKSKKRKTALVKAIINAPTEVSEAKIE